MNTYFSMPRIMLLILVMLLIGCNRADVDPTPEPAPRSSPMSLLVATRGSVQLSRAGWSAPVTVAAGSMLHPNDDLLVQDSATVLCGGPQTHLIQAPGGRACPDDQGWLNPPEVTSGHQRGAPADVPYVLSPRNTLVTSARPTLHWNDTGADGYTVAILNGAQRVWERAGVTGTSLPYPDEDPLLPGTDYLLLVEDETTGTTSAADPARGLGFGVISETLRTDLNRQREAIQALSDLDETDRTLALAIYYASVEPEAGRGLHGEALQLLHAVVQERDTPAVRLWMGDMFQATKLPQEAELAYQLAIQRAEAQGDRVSQARAEASLWHLTSDPAHLEAAIQLYEQLGDQRQAEALRAERT